jgi:bacteriorhodopsin
MNNLFLAATLQSGDYIGFTFFLGSMAMLAATVFFFVERSNVSAEWKMSMTVSGLITGIAAVHYYYMREVWVTSGISPTEFRYIDWILTVPLMVVEFYLLTKVNFQKLVWASIVMLVTGYFGEAGIGPLSPALWG